VHDAARGPEPIAGPELEYLLLARPERFVARQADPAVRAVPARHRPAQHAARVALRDCAALGLGDEASVIVAEATTPAHRGA
jgi:hypothetical protein